LPIWSNNGRNPRCYHEVALSWMNLQRRGVVNIHGSSRYHWFMSVPAVLSAYNTNGKKRSL
jgi:hypothetical protein